MSRTTSRAVSHAVSRAVSRAVSHAVSHAVSYATILGLALLLTGCETAPEITGGLSGELVFILADGVEEISREGYTITVEGPTVTSTTSSATGLYAATSLEPGSYVLRAELELWTRETSPQVTVEVASGEVASVPDLNVTPAGAVRGHVTIEGGGDASGFRLQLLGTDLSAVADADGDFVIHRVPAMASPGYELLAERADVGSARRAGVVVVPFEATALGTIIVQPGGSGTANTHPAFDANQIIFANNGTPLEEAVVPLPYRIPAGLVRRFDQVALHAPATDPDNDVLSYEWSASAGALIDPLSPEARWRPDEYAGSQATISVTVRDGHGGIARMANDVEIVDLFAGSANRLGDRVVHSYRIEGGPWLIDLVDLGYPVEDDEGEVTWQPDLFENIFELTNPGDPRPLLFTTAVVFRDDGDLMRVGLGNEIVEPLGLRPMEDSVANPTVAALPPAILVITESTPEIVTGLNVNDGVSWEAVVCPGPCMRIAADGDGEGFATLFDSQTFLLEDGTARTVWATIGHGHTVWAGGITYVGRYAGFNGRSLVTRILPLGSEQTVYEGFYNIVVWAQDDVDVLITEQEYLALRHPPFVRWLNTDSGLQGDYEPDAANWMPDRAHDVTNGIGLIRQVTRADWPEPFDESRSEIVRVDLERACE